VDLIGSGAPADWANGTASLAVKKLGSRNIRYSLK
jgi:hypothetical protein